MAVKVIVVGILAIFLLGLAIYLWIDRKGWIETARDAAETCGAIKEAYKELDSFSKALDQENVELTVKCNQYEALLKTRLDEIPVADLDECGQEVEKKIKKPCCSCWNGVYNIPACEDCDSQNNYENYVSMN